MSVNEYNRIYFGKGAGEKIYVTTDLYNVNWGNRKMKDFKVVASRYGGLVAFIPKDLNGDPTIYIHNFKDSGIDELEVDGFIYDDILYSGWTIHLQFFVVLKSFKILVYQLFAKYPKIHEPGGTESAIAADMRDNVLCVVTNKLNCFLFNTRNGFSPHPLPKLLLPSNSAITSLHILHTAPNNMDLTSILIGLSTGNAVRSKANTWEIVPLGLLTGGTNITYITMSTEGRYVALCLKGNSICILPSSLDSKVLEYKSEAPVDSLCWISDNVLIAGYRSNGLIFLSTDKIWKRNAFKSELMELIPKNNELLLINDEQVRLIHIEPPSLISIHTIGSTSPESLLYDSSESFYRSEREREISETMTQEIPREKALHDGIMMCIDASMYSLEPDKQKSYIRAALYGRCFYQASDYDFNIFESTEMLTEVTKAIRVSNTLFHEFGIPMTVPEFLKMDKDDLLIQLANYRLFDCAIQICEFLQLSGSQVLINWCCLLIDMGDEKPELYLFEKIKSKLGSYPNTPIHPIVKHAANKGRRGLALRLLEIEPDIRVVIDALISMEQYDTAFKKSESSSDTSIMLSTINTLYTKCKDNIASFYKMIRETKTSLALFLFYNLSQNSQLYTEIVDNLDIFSERFKLSYYKCDDEMMGLQTCQQYITQCSRTTKYVYDFYLEMVNQHLSLIEENRNSKVPALAEESNVRRTLYTLYSNNSPDVTKYIKKCRVDEQLVQYSRLEAYVDCKNYKNLSLLFNEKKIPPIEFVKYLLNSKEKTSTTFTYIKYFIGLITELKDRCDYYISIKEYKLAFDEAKRENNSALAQYIVDCCPDQTIKKTLR